MDWRGEIDKAFHTSNPILVHMSEQQTRITNNNNKKRSTGSNCSKSDDDDGNNSRYVKGYTYCVNETMKKIRGNSNSSSHSSSSYNSSYQDNTSDDNLPLCFQSKRHQLPIEGISCETQSWRIRERMKTVSVALVLCLNIGVDPPDIVKIQPCARLECWIDPSSVSPPKAMELIGANLQKQYERWQPRARYKKFHDPTVEDVKKLCTSLRRNAKEERVLFHYNGHGVPKPTSNGEIWVFNKTYTQYIPLSIYDLQAWMGAPSIYVYDCSNAGMIINSFNQFAEQHEKEMEKAIGNRQSPSSSQIITYKNCIQLAACSANQILPMNAQLPADLFTSCLTTPIKTALKWHTMQNTFGLAASQINNDLIEKIPGLLNDRRTMLGELNWIFTAITDTIAWNTLPRDLFQKLFRQDLLVASLFRNFLLAERILRSNDCTPVSSPILPQCFRHPMWSAWDLAVDLALQQLPDILERGVNYEQLPFFEEQLTAFQVWLDRESEERLPPEQLPIVLQVLLSQVHRMRALELLGRFLDLGPWAVNLALGVGIFPYVLKLLQSSAKELRPILVFIWAKILAVDSTCQVDLVKDHKYFLSVLQDCNISKEHRTLSAFVLASIVNNFLLGQTSALQGSLVSICLVQLYDESWLLRQWLAICLGQLWKNFAKARWSGVRDLAHEKLYPLLTDPVPEVRAAAVFALGTYISSVTERSEHANNIDRSIAMQLLTTVGEDMSPLVRLELIAALQWMIVLFESQFVSVYLQETASIVQTGTNIGNSSLTTHSLERNLNMKRGFSSSCIPNMMISSICGPSSTTGIGGSTATIGIGSIFIKLWQGIVQLGRDPYPKCAEIGQKIIEHVRNSAVCLIAAKEATTEKYATNNSSLSLPPSPNTRISYLGESPPTSTNTQINVMSNSASGAIICGNNSGGKILNTIHSRNNSAGTAIVVAAGTTIAAAAATVNHKMRNSPLGLNAVSCIGRAATPPHNPNKPRTSSMSEEHDNNTGNGLMQGNNDSGVQNQMKSIVTTNFIPWAISYFARPGNTRCTYYCGGDLVDSPELNNLQIDRYSPEYQARRWRFKRNEYIRWTAREKQTHAIFHRIDTQNWIGKSQFTPSIVKLLPYEQQIAVAYKEKVSVHDWSRNTVYSYVPPPAIPSLNANNIVIGGSQGAITSKHHKSFSISSTGPILSSTNFSGGSNTTVGNSGIGSSSMNSLTTNMNLLPARVTALEFINAHDIALILVGYDDGTVRVWQEPSSGSKETRLVSAWQGLPYGSKSNKDMSGVVTTWHQKSQHLFVGGYTKQLRLWDIERELKVCEIPTGTDSYVRVLSSSPKELIAAGCSDGSVRLFDKRCPPSEARIMTYREHTGAILAACLRDNNESLVSGCTQGKVCLFDVRASSSVQNWSAGNDVTAIAVHPAADIVACGSQYIYIYGLDGRQHTTLRSHEGFMGPRIGHTSCLSFHPHKIDLAGGFVDNTVAVYGSSGNSRNY